MRPSLVLAVLLLCILATFLSAQHRTGPIYPERQPPTGLSGYDPFQLDWSSGRFRYIPLPYADSDPDNPFKYNSYTGRWAYVPVPPPRSIHQILRESRKPAPTGNLADTAILASGRIAPAGPTAARPERLEPLSITPRIDRAAPLPPLIVEPRIQTGRPATAPTRDTTTQPASAKRFTSSARDPLHLDPKLGRWEYDETTGRWIHILPADQ